MVSKMRSKEYANTENGGVGGTTRGRGLRGGSAGEGGSGPWRVHRGQRQFLGS